MYERLLCALLDAAFEQKKDGALQCDRACGDARREAAGAHLAQFSQSVHPVRRPSPNPTT